MRNAFDKSHFSSFPDEISLKNSYFSFFLRHFSYYYFLSSAIFFFVYTLCVPLPAIPIPESG